MIQFLRRFNLDRKLNRVTITCMVTKANCMSVGETPIEDTSSSGERQLPKAAELYAEWMERMQRGRGRHAAISRNLSTWSNYKNWADKVRGSWEPDDESTPTAAPTTKKK